VPAVTAVPAPLGPPRSAPTRSDPGHQPGERRTVPLGVLVGARSGDKGGNANVGLWADADEVFTWLSEDFDAECLRGLLPDTAGLHIDRYELANLRAVNFVIHGMLGWGVASNLRGDSQAKGLGERLRSRRLAVPAALVEIPRVARRLIDWEGFVG